MHTEQYMIAVLCCLLIFLVSTVIFGLSEKISRFEQKEVPVWKQEITQFDIEI